MSKLIYPVKDFKENWYNAQEFGNKTYYGYHEGADINLKTGGNTDLNYRIYAIADGVVTSVQELTTGFGKHIHILHEHPGGDIWCHYAHCANIFVKVGDKVQMGDRVATVGSTGNSKYAHLHWAIKLQPTEINSIAKNLTELKKWTDPIKFVEDNQFEGEPKIYSESEMSAMREQRDENHRGKVAAEETANARKKTYEDFKAKLAEKLTLPSTSDEGDILGSVERAIVAEDELVKANKTIIDNAKIYEEKEKEWQKKFDDMERDFKRLERDFIELKRRRAELDETPVSEPLVKPQTRWQRFTDWILEVTRV